jgi:hypothetical protein
MSFAMGHGILYCATCHSQLRDTDFDKGLAYRLEGQSFCEGCARNLIHTLPEDRVNDILRAFESTVDDAARRPPPPMNENRGNRTTRILKALSASPGIRLTSTSRRMAVVPPESEQAAPLLVGIGIAVMVLVVLAIFAVSSDSSSTKQVPSSKTAPRR